jgi:3',5'-cyclic-nucleotide phosphodiesterase
MIRLTLLGADGGVMPGCRLPCFLLNGALAVDCGSLAHALTLEAQRRIRHVFISHAHLDHVGSLPFLANNIMDCGGASVSVYGCVPTLESLKKHLFNNVLWPDFTEIPSADRPVLRLIPLMPETPVSAEGLKITPVPVHHTVPAMAFVIEAGDKAVLIGADTGPTDRIWEVCNALPDLRAVFIETSFPDRLSAVAARSGHLTPALLGRELRKLNRPMPVYIVHIKPAFRDEIAGELASLEDDRLQIAKVRRPYAW